MYHMQAMCVKEIWSGIVPYSLQDDYLDGRWNPEEV